MQPQGWMAFKPTRRAELHLSAAATATNTADASLQVAGPAWQYRICMLSPALPVFSNRGSHANTTANVCGVLNKSRRIVCCTRHIHTCGTVWAGPPTAPHSHHPGSADTSALPPSLQQLCAWHQHLGSFLPSPSGQMQGAAPPRQLRSCAPLHLLAAVWPGAVLLLWHLLLLLMPCVLLLLECAAATCRRPANC